MEGSWLGPEVPFEVLLERVVRLVPSLGLDLCQWVLLAIIVVFAVIQLRLALVIVCEMAELGADRTALGEEGMGGVEVVWSVRVQGIAVGLGFRVAVMVLVRRALTAAGDGPRP